MVKFILSLARHGESTFNQAKLVQGQTDSPLSGDGVLQAESLGHRLANEKIDYVYTSDLLRAAQTTELILQSLRTPPLDVVKEVDFRERSFGDKEGIKISEYRSFLSSEGLTFRSHVPKGGESFQEARQRVVKAFYDVCKKQVELEKNETTTTNDRLIHVLVVGHGLLFKELLSYFIEELHVEIPGGKDRVMKDSANSNLSRFEVEYAPNVTPKMVCKFIYDYSHLPEDMQKALPSKAY
ncbi:fructose-2,6-bisphosphatase TIGAR-like [Lytechinus pictus]|uniref:fructose-2,6-bisphosphatase TIGAR-like n=1 Tax=Lytechinus pictus TaxID=7653 RepID=UPI0030B9C96F